MSIAIATSPRLAIHNHPPRGAVTAFWAAGAALTSSLQARQWLNSRGLAPVDLQALDLVRVAPDRRCFPGWMRGGRAHCVLIPLYDSTGELASIRLRDPRRPRFRGVPKGYDLKGAVMANAAALAMLRDGVMPSRLIICEGETDYLIVAMLAGTSDIAVIGVSSGSWTPDIAARVPNKTMVQIWTDHDGPGRKYANEIAASLDGRCMVMRSLETPHDINTLWAREELPLDLVLPSLPFTPTLEAPKEPKESKRPSAARIPNPADHTEAGREAIRQRALEITRATIARFQGDGLRHQCALMTGLKCGNFIDFLTESDLDEIERELEQRSSGDADAIEDTRRTFRDGVKHGAQVNHRYIPKDRPWPHPLQRPSKQPERLEPLETSDGVFEVHARFMQPEWLEDIAHGVVLLDAPHGVGKTTIIARYLAKLHGPCLYISPRTELCRTSGDEMDLSFYKDDATDMATAERLSSCLDSIVKISLTHPDGTLRRWEAIVLDELEQLVHHLFGGTIGARSHGVFQHLCTLIRQTRCLICSDADLGPMTRALLDAAFADVPLHQRPPITTLRNTYTHTRTAYFATTKQENIAHMLDALIQGEKVSVACTAAKQAKRFAKLLSGKGLDKASADIRGRLKLLHETRPELKVLLLTADNRDDPDVRATLANPNGVIPSFDAVLFSSVIGTGYSITATGYRSFLFASGGGPKRSVTAHEALQMLWRFRNPLDDQWFVWADGAQHRAIEDVDTLRQVMCFEHRLCQGIVQFSHREVGDTLQRVPNDTAHFELYLRALAHKNALTNNMNAALRAHMLRHGVELVELEPILDELDAKALRNAESHAHDAINEEHVDALDLRRQQPRIPAEELHVMRARGPRDTEERLALELDRVEQALPDAPTRDDLHDFVDSNGACVTKGKRLARLLLTFSGCMDLIARQAEHINFASSYATHLQAHIAHAVILAQFLLVAGLDPNDLEAFEVNAQDLREDFVPWVKRHRIALIAAGLNPDIKDLEAAPTKLVRAALRSVGLNLLKADQRRRNGERVRFYRIDPDALRAAWRWTRAPLERMAPNLAVTHPPLVLNHGHLRDTEHPPPQAQAA